MNNYKQHLGEILEIYNDLENKNEVAKILVKKYYPDSKLDSVRRGITKLINKEQHKGVRCATTERNNIPFDSVAGYWDKSNKDYSVYVKPKEFKLEDIDQFLDFDFSEVERIEHKPIKMMAYDFDMAVYTDVHVGMDTNPDNVAMFADKWDEEELMKRIDLFSNHILTHQKSNVLYLDDLGDYLDGYDGKTTRKGHDLPQNMSTKEAFDVGFKAKIRLASVVAPYFNEIVINNVNNDNHSGSFSYCLNYAVKEYLELRHNNIKVINHLPFISHYAVGDCLFLISHGKDDKSMKFGFKPTLDAKQEKKILNYMRHYNLLSKYKYVQFSKGDSHQMKFDNDTSEFFRYYNYPAFSPSSEWVQNNFQKGKSGAITFNFKNNGQKSINELFF